MVIVRMNSMDMKDSSDEEETHNLSAFTKFDESIEVRNAEEIQSPVSRRPSSSRRIRQSPASVKPKPVEPDSPRGKRTFRR